MSAIVSFTELFSYTEGAKNFIRSILDAKNIKNGSKNYRLHWINDTIIYYFNTTIAEGLGSLPYLDITPFNWTLAGNAAVNPGTLEAARKGCFFIGRVNHIKVEVDVLGSNSVMFEVYNYEGSSANLVKSKDLFVDALGTYYMPVDDCDLIIGNMIKIGNRYSATPVGAWGHVGLSGVVVIPY